MQDYIKARIKKLQELGFIYDIREKSYYLARETEYFVCIPYLDIQTLSNQKWGRLINQIIKRKAEYSI